MRVLCTREGCREGLFHGCFLTLVAKRFGARLPHRLNRSLCGQMILHKILEEIVFVALQVTTGIHTHTHTSSRALMIFIIAQCSWCTENERSTNKEL